MELTDVVLVLWASRIPWSLVPMRYWSTYHAASYWPDDGCVLYCAMSDMATQMSVRVAYANHMRDPTSV
jgi:hypothetical protein